MSLIYINPYAFYDTDAQAYITAVEAADGQGLEDGVKNAINSFVLGCKVDGIWSAIKASCILAGARTLAGALVPLVGTAPTNVGPFASGDYNRETGLVGNGSTKYLNSNRSNNADPQNNHHIAVYVTTFVQPAAPATFQGFIGGGDQQTGSSNVFFNGVSNQSSTRSRSSLTVETSYGAALATGIFGISRSGSVTYSERANGTTSAPSRTSQTPANLTTWVFTANNNGSPAVPTPSRFGFYSIGESLDLALLDSRVATLISAYAAAIP